MMKRIGKTFMYIAWLIVATLCFAYVWQRYLEIIIFLPEPLLLWLVDDVYGAQNADQIQDLDLICVLLISLAIVSIVTGLIAFLWKKLDLLYVNLSTRHENQTKVAGSKDKS